MKRRMVIAHENAFDENNGVFFDLGAIRMVEEAIPVGPLNAMDAWKYGTARDIERNEETGEISVEVDIPEVSDELTEQFLEMYAPSYYITEIVKVTDDEGVTHITSGRLRGITMIAIPGKQLIPTISGENT